MPTVILTKPWTMNSSGVLKNPGTEITFSRSSEELQEILDQGAGQIKQGLPADLPGRDHFIKAGFDSLQSLMGLEEWKEVKGIGDITAQKLDKYFKKKTEE